MAGSMQLRPTLLGTVLPYRQRGQLWSSNRLQHEASSRRGQRLGTVHEGGQEAQTHTLTRVGNSGDVAGDTAEAHRDGRAAPLLGWAAHLTLPSLLCERHTDRRTYAVGPPRAALPGHYHTSRTRTHARTHSCNTHATRNTHCSYINIFNPSLLSIPSNRNENELPPCEAMGRSPGPAKEVDGPCLQFK